MATEIPTPNTEVAILTRVLNSMPGDLSPAAATVLLSLEFTSEDQTRLTELSEKSNEGELSPSERLELENYVDVGHLLAILQSRARQALKQFRS
jgi:hypothetical protein